MDRKHFIKTFATMAGGLTLVNCSNDLFSDMAGEDGPLEAISIDDAKNWFETEYLSTMRAARKTEDDKKHKRKASWSRAQKPQNAAKRDYVWVPIDYEGDGRPGVVMYDEQTMFKKELSKYYLQPIIEGLIVTKIGNKNRAFLAQIAYDMQEVAANNFVIEKDKFTGTLLKVDWDDNLINGVTYEKGKPMKGFANPTEPTGNARTNECVYVLISSVNTYSVNTQNEVIIHVHNTWQPICDGSGGGSSNGGFNYFGNGNYGGGGGGGDNNFPGGSGYYDPLIHSDAGNITYPPPLPQIYNFNLGVAIKQPGADRDTMNNNLKETLYAINMVSGIQGMTWEKAAALAKSIGGNINTYTPTIVVLGKTFNVVSASLGIVGAVTSVPQAYIALTDGNVTWEDARAGIAAAATVGGIFAGGWLAVGLGTISLAIAIYDHP